MIEFHQYPPIRKGSHPNEFVRDVESHLSLKSYNYYKADSPSTTVHECCHGIHADLRNTFYPAKPINCFYLMKDRWVALPEPKWKKRDVIPFIPTEYKASSLYGLYVTSSSWDDRPLYLWDEWVCYLNGSRLGVEYSMNNALIFGFYAGAVIKKEPSFAFENGLIDLYDWLSFELESLLISPEQHSQYERLRNFL